MIVHVCRYEGQIWVPLAVYEGAWPDNPSIPCGWDERDAVI